MQTMDGAKPFPLCFMMSAVEVLRARTPLRWRQSALRTDRERIKLTLPVHQGSAQTTRKAAGDAVAWTCQNRPTPRRDVGFPGLDRIQLGNPLGGERPLRNEPSQSNEVS